MGGDKHNLTKKCPRIRPSVRMHACTICDNQLEKQWNCEQSEPNQKWWVGSQLRNSVHVRILRTVFHLAHAQFHNSMRIKFIKLLAMVGYFPELYIRRIWACEHDQTSVKFYRLLA